MSLTHETSKNGHYIGLDRTEESKLPPTVGGDRIIAVEPEAKKPSKLKITNEPVVVVDKDANAPKGGQYIRLTSKEGMSLAELKAIESKKTLDHALTKHLMQECSMFL